MLTSEIDYEKRTKKNRKNPLRIKLGTVSIFSASI